MLHATSFKNVSDNPGTNIPMCWWQCAIGSPASMAQNHWAPFGVEKMPSSHA